MTYSKGFENTAPHCKGGLRAGAHQMNGFIKELLRQRLVEAERFSLQCQTRWQLPSTRYAYRCRPLHQRRFTVATSLFRARRMRSHPLVHSLHGRKLARICRRRKRRHGFGGRCYTLRHSTHESLVHGAYCRFLVPRESIEQIRASRLVWSRLFKNVFATTV